MSDEGVMTTEFVQWMTTATESEIFDFSQRGSPRCPMCGRVEAAEDCEDDPLMCWWVVNGSDPRCGLLRTHYAAVSRAGDDRD